MAEGVGRAIPGCVAMVVGVGRSAFLVWRAELLLVRGRVCEDGEGVGVVRGKGGTATGGTKVTPAVKGLGMSPPPGVSMEAAWSSFG